MVRALASALPPTTRAQFGRTVDLSDDGRTFIVAAPYIGAPARDATIANTGAVDVYSRTDDAIVHEATLRTLVDVERAYFGVAAALSGNGRVIAVGASRTDCDQASGGESERRNPSGAVFIYQRTESGWAESSCLAPAPDLGAYGFGSALELSADGSILAVAASSPGSGALVIRYGLQSDGWHEVSRLYGPIGDVLALDASGETLVAGQPNRSAWPHPYQAGLVQVFGGRQGYWDYESFLSPSSTMSGFGSDVGLDASGQRLVVAASGKILVFDREADYWRRTGAMEAGIGGSTAPAVISADGTVIAFYSARYVYNRNDRGAVSVHSLTEGDWREQARIEAPVSLPFAGSGAYQFGFSLAISGDGSTLLIGAPGTPVEPDRAGASEGQDSEMPTGDGAAGQVLNSAGAAFVYVR